MLPGKFRLHRRGPAAVPAPISIAPSGDFGGNDGPWSTFPVKFGTPPQTVKVLISTASTESWAILPDGCIQTDPANCSVARGGLFQPNQSSTWVQNPDAAGGLYPLTLETNINVTGVGRYGYDSVSLGGQDIDGPSLDQQAVVGIATKEYYLGLFGLNPNSTPLLGASTPLPNFLSSLNSSNVIPSLSWSYTAGNQYRPGPVYGSLILGGYDQSRFLPNNVSFPMTGADTRHLAVNIGTIFLLNDGGYTILGRTDSSRRSQNISAAIDSTTPYLILPLNVCEAFEEAFGIEWDDQVQGYLVNDTLHDALQAQNASVTFNLGNSSTVPGQGFNISLPYAAFNMTAGPPLLKNASRYFPLMRAANDSQVTLGRTFLQESYVIADYERRNFSVSQCAWDTDQRPQIAVIKRPGSNEPTNGHKISAGAIAGIVVGVIVFIALIMFGVLFFRKYRPQKAGKTPEMEEKPDLMTPELPSGHDPFAINMVKKDDVSPSNPELESTVHKGHELDASPPPDQTSGDNAVYELDADIAQSLAEMSPTSLPSPRSDNTRASRQQRSDPASPSSQDSPKGVRDTLSPVSPIPHNQNVARRSPSEPSDYFVSPRSENMDQWPGRA